MRPSLTDDRRRFLLLLAMRNASKASGAETLTVTGVSPLALPNAIAHGILSLTQFGKCEQPYVPTPSDPVDIMCNNGAIKYGWYDIITTSQLSGYGTYVSPSGTAGNRAYKWYKDLPNGTYTFSVDGDYELIVQWRDPADPSTLVPSAYENLSGWMTSGEVTLDKEGGGYGIAVRRTSGTSSITPSNFDGVLHVQERGLYVVGTPEVLTVSATGAETQIVTAIPMLLSVGDYKDEVEIISGIKTGKVGVKVLDGTETWEKGALPSANYYYGGNTILNSNAENELLCNQFVAGTRNVPAIGKICVRSARNGFLITPNDQTIDTADKFKQFLAAQYAAGTPVIVLYPLATETTEQTTPHALHTASGTNVAAVTAAVEGVGLAVEYKGKAAQTEADPGEDES